MNTQKHSNNFNDCMKKQIELVKYMEEHDFDVDTRVIGAPQKFISIVANRDTEHKTGIEQLNFVETYIKCYPDKAKKEYKMIEREVKTRMIKKIRVIESDNDSDDSYNSDESNNSDDSNNSDNSNDSDNSDNSDENKIIEINNTHKHLNTKYTMLNFIILLIFLSIIFGIFNSKINCF